MNDRNQIIITQINNQQLALYLKGKDVYDCSVAPTEDEAQVGDIFVGRIENIVKNISAAFVKIKENELAYLSLTQEQLKNFRCNQEILVQVSKAAVKTKQAVLTTKIELTGKYCVVSDDKKPHGISKKITDEVVRTTIKTELNKYKDNDCHIVIRTNAAFVEWNEVENEVKQLISKLVALKNKSSYLKAPAEIGDKKPFYEGFVQSYREDEYERIVTDCYECFEYLSDKYQNVELYTDEFSIDSLYGLKTQLKKAMMAHVWLKSGGDIVIEPTEALTVIDVNTGKAIEGKRKKETTFYKINVEAAIEAVRQIRLRNISGIILIDFIEMNDKNNEANLLSILKKELSEDKTPCKFVDITALGLAEITRMKKNKPLKSVYKNV